MPLIDRIFNPAILIFINLLIIIVVETVDEGKFFFKTGLIHLIILPFIALIISRIFYHHYTHDPLFEKFVHGTLAASSLFALSHIFEYISMHIYNMPEDMIFAGVINLTLAGFIVIAISAESFLRIIANRSIYLTALLFTALFSLLGTSVLFLYYPTIISFDVNSTSYLYTLLLIACAFIGLSIVLKMKNIVPASNAFINLLLPSLLMVLISTLPYIFHEFIKNWSAFVSEHQIIYLSHFIFSIALSLLFIAFTKLDWSGIFEEVRKMAEQENKS